MVDIVEECELISAEALPRNGERSKGLLTQYKDLLHFVIKTNNYLSFCNISDVGYKNHCPKQNHPDNI